MAQLDARFQRRRNGPGPRTLPLSRADDGAVIMPLSPLSDSPGDPRKAGRVTAEAADREGFGRCKGGLFDARDGWDGAAVAASATFGGGAPPADTTLSAGDPLALGLTLLPRWMGAGSRGATGRGTAAGGASPGPPSPRSSATARPPPITRTAATPRCHR